MVNGLELPWCKEHLDGFLCHVTVKCALLLWQYHYTEITYTPYLCTL